MDRQPPAPRARGRLNGRRTTGSRRRRPRPRAGRWLPRAPAPKLSPPEQRQQTTTGFSLSRHRARHPPTTTNRINTARRRRARIEFRSSILPDQHLRPGIHHTTIIFLSAYRALCSGGEDGVTHTALVGRARRQAIRLPARIARIFAPICSCSTGRRPAPTGAMPWSNLSATR